MCIFKGAVFPEQYHRKVHYCHNVEILQYMSYNTKLRGYICFIRFVVEMEIAVSPKNLFSGNSLPVIQPVLNSIP